MSLRNPEIGYEGNELKRNEIEVVMLKVSERYNILQAINENINKNISSLKLTNGISQEMALLSGH